jgi:hypothetical protein
LFNRFVSWRERTWLTSLCLGVIALFAVAGLLQVWSIYSQPYLYALPMADDYDAYHYWAVDIVNNGLAMRAAPIPYTLPAGFAYIYFVALCYLILGIDPPAVFVAQSALLGGSVVLFFLAFRGELRRPAQLVLLVGLSLFAFVDVGRQYALQLFSENLLIFLVAAFFYLARLGFIDGRRWARIAALAVLGAIPLARPNAVPFVPLALVWVIARRGGPGFWRDLALGGVALVLVFNLMGLRNYAAGGRWTLFPPLPFSNVSRGLDVPGYGGFDAWTTAMGPEAQWRGTPQVAELVLRGWRQDPAGVAKAYGQRVLYTAGFLPLLESAYRPRPHWMVMWAVFLGALTWRLARGLEVPPMVVLLLIWLVAFLGPVIAVTLITNYGFRYVVPAVLPAVAGAVVLLLTPFRSRSTSLSA